jgi:hypothetical protein
MGTKHAVTVKRNDGRKDTYFRRWTVYVGNVAAFDIEAQRIPASAGGRGWHTALVQVLDANGKAVSCFDGRSGAYFDQPEKRQ